MENHGSAFLHQRDPQLHASQEVQGVVDYLNQNGEHIPNEPADKISAYLGFLANKDYVNDGILTGDQDSIERQIDAHVIKAKEVPEGYFDLQRRIAREQGHGDVEITPTMREQLVEAVQADQRAGLSTWVEYLGGSDGGYPNWFKQYTWASVVKLGNFDKEKGEFQKRSRGTTAAYPELNREALAYVYDNLNKARVRGETVDGGAQDEQLQKLLKAANFGKLYAFAVQKSAPSSPELRNDTRGSWTKYAQTTDPRTARRLSGSLQGHGTDWCTAGESTAAWQLEGGDFYVYYTRDEDGKDTVPRVAIRMQNGEVAEVRGVNPHQELESVMADIASEQLEDLPGGDVYIQRAADMKRLTVLEKQLSAEDAVELSSDDIRFLYELDHKIDGFGYDDDPRVRELKLKAASEDVAAMLEQLDAPADYVQRMRNYVRAARLMREAQYHPEAELSDIDMRFVYGLDGEILSLDDEQVYDLAKTIDYWREGRDRERLAQMLPEAIREQLQAAYTGYRAVADQLLSHKRGLLGKREVALSDQAVQQLFAEKDAEWQKTGVYNYMLEQLIEQGSRFNLTITPNVVASEDQLVAIAEKFGKEQPYGTYVYDDMYRRGNYSSSQWTGTHGSELVRFSLIPSKYSAELGHTSADRQLETLGQLQTEQPALHYRVPSLLDALTYWHTLRAQGDKLADSTAFNKTYIRHFDLPAKRLGGFLGVPYSCVYQSGKPYLDDSVAEDGNDARLAVG